jgi:8-oxo-dGTP diphosphatase
MVTVAAAIIEKDKRVFAARKKPGKPLAGLWELPGGKLEPGETAEECLARELAEEFGIVVRVGDYFAESRFDYGDKKVKLVAYLVKHLQGEFVPEDHDQMVWLPAEELHSLDWAPADIPLIHAYQQWVRELRADL